jgi:PAS domain S-box-containing protein
MSSENVFSRLRARLNCLTTHHKQSGQSTWISSVYFPILVGVWLIWFVANKFGDFVRVIAIDRLAGCLRLDVCGLIQLNIDHRANSPTPICGAVMQQSTAQLMAQLQQERVLRQQAEAALATSQLVNDRLARELRDSQQRLEAFFGQSLDGFFFMMIDQPIRWDDTVDREAVLDYVFAHQRMTRVNEAMLRQYGAAESDFIGLTPNDFFAHDVPTGRELWRKMLDAGSLHTETQEQKMDGTPIWIDGDYICLYSPSGEILGHFGIQRDVSDRIRAELVRQQVAADLQQSEQKFRAIFDGTFQFIGLLDPAGMIMEANRAALDAIGVDLADVVRRPFWETPWWSHSPHLQGKLRQAIAQAATGELVRFEAEHILPNGSSVFVDFSVNPVLDESGKVIMLIPEGRDISDRKRQEDILRNIAIGVSAKTGAAFFQALVEYLSKALDVEFAFVCEMIPPERQLIRTIAGYGDRQAIGGYEYELNDTPCERIVVLGESVGSYPCDVQRHFPQDTYLGEIQAEAYMGLPLTNSQGQILGLISVLSRQPIQDPDFVTQILKIFAARAAAELERQQAEVLLQQQAADLARSNAELQQFAYVASHDLQEPLRMVTSYLELLERRYQGQLDAKADQFIGYAVDGAVRMQTLINALLSYSRIGSKAAAWQPVDCAVLLQEVLTNLQVTIDQNQASITHDALPSVMADRPQLVQLFQNLIGNGIKFRQAAAPQIHIGVARSGDQWLFSVRDNGIGIEDKYVDRIFIIFQRLHGRGEYPGTGIGLAICKKIIERHGGKLWVESELNQGSTFYFTLPIVL